MVAVAATFDCHVSVCYEAHPSIITLIEAGASVTEHAKIILKEIQKDVKAIKKDPHFYALGAERETTAASRKRAKASVAATEKKASVATTEKKQKVSEPRFTEA